MKGFPDIHLEPVNRAAAMLFSRKENVTGDQAQALHADLLKTRLEVARAITSIKGQLATREYDPEWTPSAKRALIHYMEMKKAIDQFLKTTNLLLCAIAAKSKRQDVLAIREAQEQLEAANRRAKLERIKAANDESQQWQRAFRRAVKDRFGPEVLAELIEAADNAITTPTP